MDENDLRRLAEDWLSQDPDPQTRAELSGLLTNGRSDELLDCFGASLEFGTAGLRGVLGCGPNRMNRVVVIRTARGLGEYLLDHVERAASRGVVVGYDGRRYSRQFAEDTASVLAALGITVHLYSDVCPTPLLGFSVTELQAAAGVMVTASHNPAEYNGYKVYWENGAQIIPPHDTGIAGRIEKVGRIQDLKTRRLRDAIAEGLVREVGPELRHKYLEGVFGLTRHPSIRPVLPVVYTPLHGVGGELAGEAFRRCGFAEVHKVLEQASPDPDFPTVAFPNPEEKGALDLALALATRVKADLVLANDPDADRLAVAVRTDDDSSAPFRQLTGNQVGVLLADYLLTEGVPPPTGSDRLVVTTIVSSPMLRVMAERAGVHYEETLTGFKWLADAGLAAKKRGVRFVLGFEEALGYSVGELVRDKDGISAAVLFAELCSVLKSRGVSVLDRLESLYRTYGLYVSDQRSLTMKGVSGLAAIQTMMATLRERPPARIGSFDLIALRDYEVREMRRSNGERQSLSLPRSNVLAYDLAGGSRIIVRPSGTEPKVKFYFDWREPVTPHETLESAELRARARIAELSETMLQLAGAPGATA